MATPICSVSLEPTWKDTVLVVFSRLMPLNCVVEPMRSISQASCRTSDWMADWLVALSVPFLNCTASSRTRWSIAWVVWRAPSAVWTSETPSWALRWAWPRPRIWARIFSEMARPAASSAARLMRKPELRRSIDSVTLPLTAVRLRWALNASTLFWIRRDMRFSLNRPRGHSLRPRLLQVRRQRSHARADSLRWRRAVWTHPRRNRVTPHRKPAYSAPEVGDPGED